MPIERVGAEAFDGKRLRRPGRVAVAFLADWCPFCRAFRPEFEALRDEEGASLLVADTTDFESPLWDQFLIEVVPTVIVFDQGVEVFRRDGVAGEGLGAGDAEAIRAALHPAPHGPHGPSRPARSGARSRSDRRR